MLLTYIVTLYHAYTILVRMWEVHTYLIEGMMNLLKLILLGICDGKKVNKIVFVYLELDTSP